MFRMLPGTIKEGSGPALSTTGGGAGYHPGEKCTTLEPDTNRVLLQGDNAAVLAQHQFTHGQTADWPPELFDPSMKLWCPGDTTLGMSLSYVAVAVVTNIFFTGERVANPDGNAYPLHYVDAGGSSYSSINKPGWWWYGSQASVIPLVKVTYPPPLYEPVYEYIYNLVVEAFGINNLYGWGSEIFLQRFDMPLNDGHINKHMPMFY